MTIPLARPTSSPGPVAGIERREAASNRRHLRSYAVDRNGERIRGNPTAKATRGGTAKHVYRGVQAAEAVRVVRGYVAQRERISARLDRQREEEVPVA